ncbi:MAG: hypothetical protein H7039_11860 [Bryobacteraceae bacterium]|nr:hypothetical protein [Bryobacteraceae bacterium]
MWLFLNRYDGEQNIVSRLNRLLMPAAIVVLGSIAGFAQEQARPGILRGRLLQLSATGLTVTTNAGEAVECTMDNSTYLEREGQRIFSGALRTNDPLEIIADRKPGSCHARTIRVIAPGTRLLSLRPTRSSLDHIFPRGNLTFSGVIRRLNANVLVLRTREEPEKMVFLREDTRYLDSGMPADFQQLGVNTRVFIRGGRNLDNNLEAYQVIWGEIEGPKSGH